MSGKVTLGFNRQFSVCQALQQRTLYRLEFSPGRSGNPWIAALTSVDADPCGKFYER